MSLVARVAGLFGRSVRAEGGAGWSMTIGQKLELIGQMFGRPTKAGRSVTWETALEVSTVLACMRVIAEGLAQAPLKLYRERSGGRGADPATDHPVYRLLYRRPNAWQTSFAFRETMAYHIALTGDFFAFKNILRGTLVELLPLKPDAVRVKQNADYSLSYTVRGENGRVLELTDRQIWHVRGPSWNSYRGLELVKLAREAIGLAMRAEETQIEIQRRGARIPGVIGMDTNLSTAQYADLAAYLKDHALVAFEELGLLILDRSAKFQSVAMSGVDAQTIETRRLQVEEICREFRVMPIMVGHADKTATYASAEQMFIAHAVHTLGPWFERIEQAIDTGLLTESDWQNGYYAKHNVNALLRGALKDEAEYFAKALGSGGTRGWMTQNEVRALKEMNPLDGGDELPMPTNLPIQPAEKPTSAPEPEPETAS